VIEVDSVWHTEEASQDYLVDVNGDLEIEKIRHRNINKPGQSIELHQKSGVKVIGIFNESEIFISKSLLFADVNGDSSLEILFVTAVANKASLYIIENFFPKSGSPPESITQVDLDTIEYINHHPDVVNANILTIGADIFLDLQAGYSIQPRKIYSYNLLSHKLRKSPLNSITVRDFEIINSDNRPFILAKKTIATANSFSVNQLESFKNSANADSNKAYEHIKDQCYRYGDFAAYTLLLNDSLQYAFEPISWDGWSKYTSSVFVVTDKLPMIVSLINDSKDDMRSCLASFDLQGRKLKQVEVQQDVKQIFSDTKQIVAQTPKGLVLLSGNLDIDKVIGDIQSPVGFIDLDKNGLPEFLAFQRNQLLVFTNDFKSKAVLTIEQEFAPLPVEDQVLPLYYKGKNGFIFHSRLFYYLLSYEPNPYYYFQIPFYFLVFLFGYLMLFLLVKLNIKRLQLEKMRLERTVEDRTIELRLTNEQLALKNAEIETKAKELNEINIHLSRLDQFKRVLISTLVHDLKNPLSQIMSRSTDKHTRFASSKMLGLVTNLLDVEKYDQATIVLDKQRLVINDLVNEVISGHEISLQEKNLKVDVESKVLYVIADGALLIRVFENLLVNAIHHAYNNSSIQININPVFGEEVKIEMMNNGPHIPDVLLEAIFDKFVQIGNGSSRNYRSTGLGLTFCRMVVEAHGYTIKAMNTSDGVSFSFTLEGGGMVSPTEVSTQIDTKVFLSQSDRALLAPWLAQLRQTEIYRVSEITRIIDSMPSHSAQLVAFKQQVYDAAFSLNHKVFLELIQNDQD
jgi:signal transduction histidine kinase